MKKYAICGVSNRALSMFIGPLVNNYSSESKIVGLLDIDQKRFEKCKDQFPSLQDVPTFLNTEMEEMIETVQPDCLIVAGRDDTHVEYILKALESDIDVITEKPMVTNVSDAQKVLKAEKKSKGKVTVTFNYRYSPVHRKIKELIKDGKIGKVTSIDLNWYIDTYHGASYFKRWNRKREFSGGLSIHKSSHHFDLVNWWIDQIPEQVFAYGNLHYFGKNGEANPSKQDGRYCGSCDEKNVCSYYMRWNTRSASIKVQDDHVKNNENVETAYTNYRPDACIFDSEIDIEDNYAATVKYNKGALLSYSVNFSAPYEGYRLAINGTKGRIETTEYHEPKRIPFPIPEQQVIDYYPLFGSKETIYVVHNDGGHGGGDPLLLEDLFLGPDPLREYEILAGVEAGAYSIALGEAVWKSSVENIPINIHDLIK